MPHQLLFTSAAVRQMRAPELADLMRRMRQQHEHLQVTGLLLYCQGTFLHVLEGARADLKRLYEEMQSEDYHHGLTTIRAHQVEQREFSEWAMGFCELTEQDINEELEGQHVGEEASAYSHFMDESKTIHQLRRLARKPSFAYETLMRFKGR